MAKFPLGSRTIAAPSPSTAFSLPRSTSSNQRVSLQRVGEEPHPVLVHDPLYVRLAVPAAGENVGDFVQVGDRVEIVRRLLFAKSAVEVGPHAAMVRVPGQLADVVD